jgi:1-acyl-sn-glycerol-3-phosphate acyltransferase
MSGAKIIPIDGSDGTPPRRKPATKPAAKRAKPRPTTKAAPASEDLQATVDAETPPTTSLVDEAEHLLASGMAFVRKRLNGEFDVDEFGFDQQFNDGVLMPMVRPLYEKWFRVELHGLENVPEKGAALIVANHSGTIAIDAVMTQLALHDHHPAHRNLRMLGADLVFTLPFLGEIARRSGHTVACNPDAERLLSGGEIVGVWPEGFKGIGKPYRDRYKLQRFGRGGFVSAALRTKSPIIPCAIVGAEEIYPILGNAKFLARLLGLPYFPLTPTFPWLGPVGMVPLPSKWHIEFGEPIPTDQFPDGAADDPMLVFNLTDQVRETIQHTLYKLLMQRRSVFF